MKPDDLIEDIVRTLNATAAKSINGGPHSIIAHFVEGVVAVYLATCGEPVE